MALRISLSSSPAIRSPSPAASSSSCSPRSLVPGRPLQYCRPGRRAPILKESARGVGRGSGAVAVRSSLEATVPAVGRVTEVDKDTFWPLVEAAGDKVVVLDMYTQWCGPCKLIAPKFQALSEKYDDVVFMKLDCNQDNKPLAKALGIKVVPTFKILKDGKIVKEITGAKFDDLVLAIEAVRTS